MIRWPKNFWPSFKVTLFFLGVALPFYAPDKADARCGCHRQFMFDQISAPQVVTQFSPDEDTTPIGWSSLTSVTDLRPQSWSAQLARDLISVWTALSSTSSQRPSHRDSTNEPCRGPFCSGDVPPTAIPVSTLVPVSNESASLLGANPMREYESSTWCIAENLCDLSSSCLDSIFHPPRSV
jgi:hypothetical protein